MALEQFSSNQIQCPYCGATLKSGQETCPACGAPSTQSSVATQREHLEAFLESANQELMKAGSGAAESAFGVGCSLGVLLGVLVWLVIFALGMRNWIVLFILALGMALAGAGLAAMISLRARSAAVSRMFHATILPQFTQHLEAHRLSSGELRALADEVLEPDAPLRTFLSSLPTPDERPMEEKE